MYDRGVTRSILLIALALLATSGTAAQPPSRVAIVGVDGADWMAIDKLVAAGRLPTFAALKKVASTGVMRPDPPLLSPLIWTSIATGRRPEDHGVLDFMVDIPGGGQAPVSGGARQTKALWEIFSDAGRSVFVAGWWATWPADHVRGAIVSDRLAPPHVRLARDSAGVVYPPDRFQQAQTLRVGPEQIEYATLNRFVPTTHAEFDAASAAERDSRERMYRNRIAHVRAALAAARTYRSVAATLIPAMRPSFTAVYYDLVDTTSHLFAIDAARRDAAVASAYLEVDEAIRDTARILDPDTLLLVVSDHGFYPPTAGIAEDPSDLTAGAAAWHRPYGIVAATTAGALAGTREPPPAHALGDVSPLDIGPTILARAGLPVANDMPGRIVPALSDGAAVTRIATYGAHRLPEDGSRADAAATRSELERLRSLGYVSGSSAVTSLARVNLGEILFRKGDHRGAIRELEAVLRADALNQRAAMWLARSYIAANREDDAVRLYDRLVQAASAGATIDPVVVLAATDLDLRRDRRQAAAERLARLPAALTGSPEVLIARGSIADAEHRPSDAERWFMRALSAQPASFDALSRLVDVRLGAGRVAEASRAAIDAARRFPDSPERNALAGETALAERRYADAAKAFAAALELAPDAASVRVELARAELALGHADAALRALEATATRDAEVLRGAAYSQQRDWRRAVDAYQRATKLGPATVELLNALGNAQLEAGRAEEAAATLERSLAMDTNQPQIRILLDRARRQQSKSRS